ncbi:MAG: glycosyltransferase [bacterium]|nr:glycosyltransferase [bacterium]
MLALTGMDVEILPVFKVPHDQIPLYMGAADVLALTSDHEASPCVIKEALASNLPIVSVRVGDVEERIAGVNGCFLCSQTPSDVADKLQLALAHSGPTNGREAVKTISLKETARRTISVLEAATGDALIPAHCVATNRGSRPTLCGCAIRVSTQPAPVPGRMRPQ